MRKIFYLIPILITVGLIYLYSGGYDISATKPHLIFVESLIKEMKENSIRANAKNISIPELDDKLKINKGFKSYDEMCVVCHGAPGKSTTVIQRGLYPKPPKLYEDKSEWSDKEHFWIIKNGIKLTGMPAYGPTHKDEDIWEIVAFLNKLPDLSIKEYISMKEKTKQIKDEHDHVHSDGEVHKH